MTIGAILLSISYTAFAMPNNLLSGGVGGLALILNYILKVPLNIGILVLNIPVFIWGFKELDKKFMIYSMIGAVSMVFIIPIVKTIIHPKNIDLILASIYSGVLSGMGVGFFLRGGASSGGTDIIGSILKKRKNMSIGTVGFICNLIIMLGAMFLFKFEVVLYSLVSIYIGSKVVDVVVEGLNKNKSVIIISDNYKEISKLISNNFSKGVTLLNGYGGFSGENKTVVNCVVSNHEIAKIKEIVNEVDKSAFMFVTETTEVFGGSFKKIN